jgi:flavodoxin
MHREEIMKSLVVFYSLTDKTKLVSQTIAKALNATLLEIEEAKPRKLKSATYLTAGFAAIRDKRTAINPVDVDLRQYDTIFIGSPIWASRPTPAINSFIYASNFEGKSVVPFFTMGGNNAEKALQNITAKIEKSQGRVTGSFAIKSYGSTDDEIIARAKEATKDYVN